MKIILDKQTGYLKIRNWDNRGSSRGFYYLHRYIMEQDLGRKLSSNEIVHHINEDKLDNRLENLQVITRAEHNRLHKIGKRYTSERLSLALMGNQNARRAT